MMSRNVLPSQFMKSVLSFCQGPWGQSCLTGGSTGRVGDGLMHIGHRLM